jgi:hypothetical protein
MANIQSTNKFTYPLQWNIEKLNVTVNTFPLFPETVEVFWELIGGDFSKEGTMIIPQEIVSQWGTNDSILEDYVIEQLNLTRSTTEETQPTEENLSTEETLPTEETPPTEPIV